MRECAKGRKMEFGIGKREREREKEMERAKENGMRFHTNAHKRARTHTERSTELVRTVRRMLMPVNDDKFGPAHANTHTQFWEK